MTSIQHRSQLLSRPAKAAGITRGVNRLLIYKHTPFYRARISNYLAAILLESGLYPWRRANAIAARCCFIRLKHATCMQPRLLRLPMLTVNRFRTVTLSFFPMPLCSLIKKQTNAHSCSCTPSGGARAQSQRGVASSGSSMPPTFVRKSEPRPTAACSQQAVT